MLSSFGYALDEADQRTKVRREDGFQIDYDYDPIGQLVAAEGSEPGWQFGYQYDERGNPLRREHSGFVRSNSFNGLNQQAESLWSGGAVILGAVSTTNAIIEINSQSAFAWGLEGMLVFGATNLAVQAGSNEFVAVVSDIFGRSDTNAITVNVQDQAFAYDRNGNLTNDGVRVYSWDQADRLVEVRDLQTDELLVQNRYDGLGRRRERIMASVAGGEDPGSTNRYVYDGWLVVAVLDGDNDVLEQYVHGMDLSGTREGAGGIGGILQVVGDEVAYYHYDGNGNVTTITDHQGTSISRLEYDPFGRVLVTDGPYAPRYQFSSKEYDAATRLNYYGYRFYAPELGRWLNRDPIGEEGGINVYAFLNNEPIAYVDHLGLRRIGPHNRRPPNRRPPGQNESSSSEGCCEGQPFDPSTQCCEGEGEVVEKETYWVCKSRLRSWLPIMGPISHSSICCEDPAANPDQTCFGKYPEGNKITSPGVIRHDRAVAVPDNCSPEKVCPLNNPCKDGVPDPGPSGCRYWVVGANCHDFARP